MSSYKLSALVQRGCPRSHVVDSPGHSVPKQPHLMVDLFEPRPPLSYCPCDNKPPPTDADRAIPILQRGKARLHKYMLNLRRKRVRTVESSPPEVCRVPAKLRSLGDGADA